MQGHIADIKARVALWQRQKYQIDRQKLMIDNGKFVFWHEFYQQAVEPAMKRHDRFEAVYDGNAWRISRSLRNLTSTFNVEVERLPYSQIPNEIRSAADEFIAQEAEMIKHLVYSDAFGAVLGEDAKNRGITEPYWNKDINGIISKLKEEGLPGYYVGDIRVAMDLSPPLFSQSRSGYYEFSSLVKGEGNIAADFLAGVNALQDRSGFFPDKKPPRGNRRDNDKSRAGIFAGNLAHNY